MSQVPTNRRHNSHAQLRTNPVAVGGAEVLPVVGNLQSTSIDGRHHTAKRRIPKQQGMTRRRNAFTKRIKTSQWRDPVPHVFRYEMSPGHFPPRSISPFFYLSSSPLLLLRLSSVHLSLCPPSVLFPFPVSLSSTLTLKSTCLRLFSLELFAHEQQRQN